MFTEHIGNLHSATSLDQLKQVLEQILGDCESALTHNGTLDINGALKPGATGAVVNISNGYIAPNDATTAPDDNGNLPNGWGLIIDGGLWVKGQFKADQGALLDFEQLLALFPIGFQMPWHDETDIPTNWAIMDGVSNAAGSGIDRGGRVGYGYISGDPTFGTLGATVAISLATSFSGSGTANTSNAGNHIHEITGTQILAAIAISDHAASSGGATIVTDTDFWIVNDSPASGNEAFDGTNADATFTGSLGDVNDEGHNHTIQKSAIAGAVADHTLSATITNAETGSTADHLHTVTISNIASGLSIGTPTTVRPPGVVELWIEKIS